jgi:hypothetical protein
MWHNARNFNLYIMNTFNVISADLITKAGIEPFIGLTVVINGKQEQIARTCKQALLDLHKSARGSNIPAGLFDNGVASANPLMLNQFRNAIIGLINKTGFADVAFHEAGDDYIASEESTAVKNGEAKVGDTLKTLKKGSRVEGFLTFPLTDLENAQRAFMDSANPMLLMQGLFGISAPAPVSVAIPTLAVPTETPADKLEQEVFGTTEELEFETPEEVLETEEPKAEKAKVAK